MTDKIEKESWHFDKRVPLATIWVLVIQLAGGIWFAAQMNAQVNNLSVGAAQRDARIARVEATTAAQAVSFATLNAQLASLRESMVEMKEAQRETNSLLREMTARP